MVIRAQLVGAKRVKDRLEGMVIRAADPSPIWEKIHDYLMGISEEQFLTEGGRGGEAWADLVTSTVEAKMREGMRPEILRREDTLFDSLASEGNFHVKKITPDSLLFGTSDPIGVFHQEGTIHLPARPPIALTDDDRMRITEAVNAWIFLGVAAISAEGATGSAAATTGVGFFL